MALNQPRSFQDEQVAQNEQRILDLKTHRNTHAPISRLPPELLLRIFEIFITMAPNIVKRWHRITHVCRHWRWIAVGAPTLWTFLPTYLKDYTLLMLKRSKTAPLVVALREETSELATAAIFDHLPRIQELQIRQSGEKLIRTQEILLLSSQKASDLVGLEVANMGDAHETVTLPSTPFSQSKSLQCLDLCHMSIEWDIFPLPNLTSLSLRTSLSMTTSLEQILGALTGMPSLESLFLQLDLNMVESTPPKPDIIHLHHLRSLGLGDFGASQLRHLLSRLYLPSLTSLGADVDPEAAEIVDLFGALAQISSTLESGKFPTLDLLSLSAFSGEFTLSPRHAKSDLYTVTIQLPPARDQQNNHHHVIRQFMAGMTSIARNNFECLTHLYRC